MSANDAVSGDAQVLKKLRTEKDPRDLPLLDAPASVMRWQVEMHETARDLKGEIDSKLSALQALIRVADEESCRLERAIAEAVQLGIVAHEDPLLELDERGEVSPTVSRVLEDLSDITSSPQPPAFTQTVHELAEAGKSSSVIAEQIGVPIGEVELVLSLPYQSDGSPGS